MPDIFHWVQLRRVGWQGQEGDVVGHLQPPTRLVPAGAVADEDGVRTWGHLSADLLEMLVHGSGVGGRHDDGGADAALGADRAKQVDGGMAVVAHHERSRPHRGPDVGVSALLADPGLVLEPDLYGRGGGAGEQRFSDQIGKVFLNVSWAAASVFGWNGRGCNRVSPN